MNIHLLFILGPKYQILFSKHVGVESTRQAAADYNKAHTFSQAPKTCLQNAMCAGSGQRAAEPALAYADADSANRSVPCKYNPATEDIFTSPGKARMVGWTTN